ncbi:MAG: T9SS type A sorting domain-containing protein [Ignavibacteriaceae bacterium]|nr:T9SS type A sorting domain-containing protein [Ignavibacteriaceae bacterium]
MKKLSFILLLLTVFTVLSISIPAQKTNEQTTKTSKTILVTFSVNMELERLAGYFHPGSDTVSVGGNFNAWGKTNMTISQSNSDIYNTTVSITASVQDTIRFNFFHSQNTWETVGIREFFITQSDYDSGVIPLDTIVFNAEFPKPQINLVTFKCYMSRQLKRGTFVIGDKVFVRGNFNGWSGNDFELKDVDRDSIYSTVLYGFKEGQSLVFKFTHNHGGTDVWESTGNRMLTVAAGQNIYTACWEDICVYTPTKTIQVAFSINMEYERLSGLFNPLLDTVSVRGSFNNWSKTLMTASTLNPDIYEVVAPVIASVGEAVRFRFFYSPGTWETDNLSDNTQNDRYFVVSQADFDATSMLYEASFNNASMETVLNQPASVKFTCNTNGAPIINAPQGTEFTTIHIAGEYSPLQWPSDGWPDADSTKMIQLYDDGTHEDAIAGDKIFTTVVTFPTFTPLNIHYKYSANWGLPTNGGVNDNEAYFGLSHDIKLGRFTSSKTVIDSFGVFKTLIGDEVEKNNTTIPSAYKLEQNYPNPFNPETVISWQLAAGSFVTLKVYDVLGNEVATLVNEEQPAGSYQVNFNTQLTTNNKQLSSGIYFYQLRAGNFVQTKKMILLR